jgi:hypothetical protein
MIMAAAKTDNPMIIQRIIPPFSNISSIQISLFYQNSSSPDNLLHKAHRP